MTTDNSSEQSSLWGTGEPVKRCYRCGKVKPLTDFRMQGKKGQRRHRSSYCTPCRNAARKEWGDRNPEKRLRINRAALMKWNYKITREDYARMLAEQGGVCKICGNPEKELDAQKRLRPLSVDHDHTTGEARDLLCADCNRMLGSARDNPATLRAAADYLERHAANGG